MICAIFFSMAVVSPVDFFSWAPAGVGSRVAPPQKITSDRRLAETAARRPAWIGIFLIGGVLGCGIRLNLNFNKSDQSVLIAMPFGVTTKRFVNSDFVREIRDITVPMERGDGFKLEFSSNHVQMVQE